MTAESKKTIKALIIDDEELVVSFMSGVMQAIGIKTITASDGDSGWDMCQKEKPDIVFCDVYMPGMNGLMLLAKLKERNKDLPVILLTSYQHYKQISEQSKARPDRFLEKPVKVKEILRILVDTFPQLRSKQK